MRLDESELVAWGTRIGRTVETPVVIGLSGELGAGKSVLARAIGLGAGVREPMPSPSFTLLQRYPADRGRFVVHMDLYRISSPEELWELGWEQTGTDGEIVLVEWPERAGALMPADHWVIGLSAPRREPRLRDVTLTRIGSPSALAPLPAPASGA